MVITINKTDLLETNEPYQKVLYYFFSFPEAELGLTKLSEKLDMSKVTANKIVKKLEKEGFLKKKVYGKTWSITCDSKHEYNFTKKIAFNLQMIYSAYYDGLRDIVFDKTGNVQSVILFGSYRKGDDIESSDVDLAVEVPGAEEQIIQIAKIKNFGYRKNVTVNMHVFSRQNINKNLFSNIANGIVLEGFLEAKP